MDYLIVIGGGLLIDSLKVIGIIIDNFEFSDVLLFEGVALICNKCVLIIVILIIVGIVVEVMINYVIIDEEKKCKFVCVDVYDVLIVVLVDLEMMESMLKGLIVVIGMDVLIYVIEGYIIKVVWVLIDVLYLEVICLIFSFLCGVVENIKEG